MLTQRRRGGRNLVNSVEQTPNYFGYKPHMHGLRKAEIQLPRNGECVNSKCLEIVE